MKIIVGVDPAGRYKSALNMAARLKFPDTHWTLATSMDLTVPMSGYGTGVEAAYGSDYIQLLDETVEQILEEARVDACAHGISPETVQLSGGAALALSQYAEDTRAELVAVDSERKGRLGSLFLGSVSRGLAIGASQSVLVTKGDVAPKGPLNVVFATDHSDYANRALDKLLSWAPAGIQRVHVVCAFHAEGENAFERIGLIDLNPSVAESLRQETKRRTDEVVLKFLAAGYPCSGEMVDLHVAEAINHAMTIADAQLLIMGAQGHGFMHRVLLGSTSLHQVVVEPHSILIVRP